MTKPRYPIGVTGRGRGQDDPLLHANTGAPRTRTGRTDAALCGAGVRPRADLDGFFDPEHDRACGRCAAEWHLEAPRWGA